MNIFMRRSHCHVTNFAPPQLPQIGDVASRNGSNRSSASLLQLRKAAMSSPLFTSYDGIATCPEEAAMAIVGQDDSLTQPSTYAKES